MGIADERMLCKIHVVRCSTASRFLRSRCGPFLIPSRNGETPMQTAPGANRRQEHALRSARMPQSVSARLLRAFSLLLRPIPRATIRLQNSDSSTYDFNSSRWPTHCGRWSSSVELATRRKQGRIMLLSETLSRGNPFPVSTNQIDSAKKLKPTFEPTGSTAHVCHGWF